MDYLVTFFRAGGPFMYAILIVLIAGIAIIIERAIFILGKNRIDNIAFVNRVLEFIQHNNIKSAIEFCSVSNAALPRVTRAGLEEANSSAADIQNAFELAALAEIPKLEKRTSYLATIANISTLLGLLGTIFGLIGAFEAVSAADASMKATLLSGGISQALNTTAFGLISAIPCMVAYSMIQEKTNELIDEINQNIARIYKNLMAAKMKKGQ